MKTVKLKSIRKINSDSKRYDIEVKDNHNFFANNMLVHNCSTTFYFNDEKFGACGRNYDMKYDEKNTYWHVAKKDNIEDKLKQCNFNVAIQGEIVGPKIQKNVYALSEPTLYVFNVYNIDKQEYLGFSDFIQFCDIYGFRTVPLIAINFKMNSTVDELVELSQEKSLLNKDIQREGIVFRTLVEETDAELGRLSFKVINPKYLLKHDD